MGVRTVSLALPITYTHFVVMVTPLLFGCLTLKETFNQPPHRLAPTCGTISAGGHTLEINRFNTSTYAHIIYSPN